MNEFEKLEAELRELKPSEPSAEFTSRLESALGEAGKVAVRCLPDDDEEECTVKDKMKANSTHLIRFHRLLAIGGLSGLGLAAIWAFFFYISGNILSDESDASRANVTPIAGNIDVGQPLASLVEDVDSPIHGLSLEQIQDVSVMPVNGWLDPQSNERLLRMVDEGVFLQPSGFPARRVRHFFMDETLWSHPASDTRVLSTTPREEVILIELETY